MLATLDRYYQTVRHLKREQVVGQIAHRFRRWTERCDPSAMGPVPEYPGCRWKPRVPFLAPGPQNNLAGQLQQGKLTFLNRTESVGWPPQWDQPQLPRLWQYNLHYFEYLWTLDYPEARRVVSDWIARHPLGRGRVGWEAYPISLRLMNWCAVFFDRYRRQTEADVSCRQRLWESIYLQAQWLSGHIEYRLLGNHLLENAAALALVGSCFSGRAASTWLAMGQSLLTREIPEQVLPDGGHFERSPMYQCRVGYVLACLANVLSDDHRHVVVPALCRTVRALLHLTHPDGDIALVNDSAMGIYNRPCEIAAFAAAVTGEQSLAKPAPSGPFALPDTGYYGWRGGDGSYIICDAGPLGPDYLLGHAHGDMLSFELSLSGQRLIVDSGVYGYEPSPLRQYCRSTVAHNNVQVDGRDQAEFWGAFRVGRRGRPDKVTWRSDESGFELSACHGGFSEICGFPLHKRAFRWYKYAELHVRDSVASARQHHVVGRVHFHPGCEVRLSGEQSIDIRTASGDFRLAIDGSTSAVMEAYDYCPQFGRIEEGQGVVYATEGRGIDFAFCFSPLSLAQAQIGRGSRTWCHDGGYSCWSKC